ncbi:MAG: CcmD family protein [Nitrospinae bacterium]|nr:CcmD family protein [Nitrospinota bacterium]
MNEYVTWAYGLIWVGFFGYALWIGMRLARLEKEIKNLDK